MPPNELLPLHLMCFQAGCLGAKRSTEQLEEVIIVDVRLALRGLYFPSTLLSPGVGDHGQLSATEVAQEPWDLCVQHLEGVEAQLKLGCCVGHQAETVGVQGLNTPDGPREQLNDPWIL